MIFTTNHTCSQVPNLYSYVNNGVIYFINISNVQFSVWFWPKVNTNNFFKEKTFFGKLVFLVLHIVLFFSVDSFCFRKRKTPRSVPFSSTISVI